MVDARARALALAVWGAGAVLPGCSSDPEPAAPPARGGVYSESHDFAEVERQLPMLASRSLGLIQVMSPEDLRTPALRSLVAACEAQGVELRAWLVLPQAQGYWPGETNADAFGAAVDAFLAWRTEESLPVRWITFDMEPAWDYTRELMSIAGDTNNPKRTDDLIARVRSHVDRAAYERSVGAYREIVARVHRAGLSAHVVTYPIVLDDAADGDPDLQDGFDTPVAGIDWDEVSFMVYRSTMERLSGAAVSSDLFLSYGADAVRAFGDRAALDLGLVGGGLVNVDGGYTDPAVLAEDVSMARAAGVSTFHLYSFEGARASGADRWLSFTSAPAAAAPPDPGTQGVRVTFQLLDSILDGP